LGGVVSPGRPILLGINHRSKNKRIAKLTNGRSKHLDPQVNNKKVILK
jgi:hypothetical protein